MTAPLCKIARESGGPVPLDCLFECPHRCAEMAVEGPRVIVAGSRSVTDYRYVQHAMYVMLEHYRQGPFVQIVSGAARGVDRLGERWARENNLPVKTFAVSPLEWQAAPRTAGHIRNGRMAEYATHLVAIWDGRSGGTANMVRTARAKGLTTLVSNLASMQYEFYAKGAQAC